MKIFLLQLDLKKKIGLCYVRAPQPVGNTQEALKKMQIQSFTFRLLRLIFEDKPENPCFMKS